MLRSAVNKMVMGRIRAGLFLAGAAAIVAALLVLTAGANFGVPDAQAQAAAKGSWQLDTVNGPDSGLSRVTGLSQGQHEVIEQRIVSEGGRETIVKVPGRPQVPNIVLRRPLTGDQSLADWHRMLSEGQERQARTNGSIVYVDGAGRAVAKFNFTAGWPADYRVDASGDAPSEEVELVVEDLDRVTP